MHVEAKRILLESMIKVCDKASFGIFPLDLKPSVNDPYLVLYSIFSKVWTGFSNRVKSMAIIMDRPKVVIKIARIESTTSDV